MIYMKINYKKISNWSLATEFFHTWKDIFKFLKENEKEFYIWHSYFKSDMLLSCVSQNQFLTVDFKPLGFLSDELENNIYNIKFKRANKKKSITLRPKLTISHFYRESSKNSFIFPTISHNTEVRIPEYEYGVTIDNYVNILEKLFDKINLMDKKKLIKGINRWNIKKDKWSLISFWECINNIFKIEYDFYYYLDDKLNNVNKSTTHKGIIRIDTKEHYHMVEKSIEWMKEKRRKENQKAKEEKKSNI